MKLKTKIVLILGAALMTLVFMKFGPHGSFDPTEIGFYTSIGAGVFWYLATYLIFKKVLARKSDEDNDP